MADWGRRFTARYRFMRVSRATGNEVGVLTMLKGGTVTRNNDVRVYDRAEAECIGRFDIGADLVRIYMTATWPDGTSEDVCLGTFVPYSPSRDVKTGYTTASVKMNGRLQELLDDGFAKPVTLTKGTNAVKAAADVCRQQGIEVIADESDFEITRTRSYGIGLDTSEDNVSETKLDMVNDLLSLAGFRAAKTDPYGRVLLKRYVDLDGTTASWDFTEGPDARFEREMTDERDTSAIANHVVTTYRTDEGTFIGEAWDDDPGSEFSTAAIGRAITKGYTYNELPSGSTDAERQQAADRMAKKYLAQNQSVVHKVTVSHVYAPVSVNDAVNLVYPSAGISGKYEVRVQQISLSGGCPVKATLRNYRR